jgi:hypothetical protein
MKRARNLPAKRRALVNLYDTGGSGSGSTIVPKESSLPPPSTARSIFVDKDKVCVQNLSLSLLHVRLDGFLPYLICRMLQYIAQH